MDTTLNGLWNDFRDKRAPNFQGGENVLADLIEPVFGPTTFTGSTLEKIQTEKNEIVGNMLVVMETMKVSGNTIAATPWEDAMTEA